MFYDYYGNLLRLYDPNDPCEAEPYEDWSDFYWSYPFEHEPRDTGIEDHDEAVPY